MEIDSFLSEGVRNTVEEKQKAVIKNPKAFVTIHDIDYCVDDWLTHPESASSSYPLIIVNVFDDNGKRFVVIRDETHEHTIITLYEFIQKIEQDEWIKVSKPIYRVSDTFKNKFTEKAITIMEVPYAKNDETDEYVYFVLEESPTYGKNFKAMSEQEVTDFYQKDGVE